ncbi:uncharacterized protein LOC133199344 [Saccostrea echinata]|uniref:uncharacterized protein LOC133199344 n=1 Tax=Saccostrea echinata TaxID=191078 RepID=UPI002A822AF1|nr:uncharacterized protein LOC133199344 [Saccostrea echinata]
MPAPYAILEASTALVGLVGSLFMVLVISVDSWEEADFSLNAVNNSYLQVSVATSNSELTIYSSRESLSDPWTTYYYYYQYWGLWKICDLLTDTARATMKTTGVDRKQCFNFLTDYDEESRAVSTNTKSFMGLHNSTVVCFMVTIIDLIVANFLAALGIYKKHVPVCMVAGALYCIASVFIFFGLVIFHVQHHYEQYYCQALYDIQDHICSSRSVSIGWPVPVAWFGLILCGMDSVLWVFLTQAMRIIKTKTMSDRY